MTRNFAIASATVLLLVIPGSPVRAQSAADWISKGDAAYAARNAPDAITAYEKAIAIDSNNYAALWRDARSQVDVATFDQDADKRTAIYASAQAHAARAVQVNPAARTVTSFSRRRWEEWPLRSARATR